LGKGRAYLATETVGNIINQCCEARSRRP
jgi:hypothetical protein